MDSAMNNFISDQLHVAQQSRREKLRVQHCSPARSGQRVDDTSSGVEVVQPIFNSNLIQVGDGARNNATFMYHPAGTSSEIPIEFSTSAMDERASVAANSINLVSSNFDGSLSPRRESNLESCGVWKSVGHNLGADNWDTNCNGTCRKRTNQGVVNDLSAVEMRAKDGIMGHPQIPSHYGEMNFGPQLGYHNALNNEVTTAVVGFQPNWIVRGNTYTSWGSYGGESEPVGIVPYGYQSDGARLLSCSVWNNGEINSQLQGRTVPMVVDSHSQGLSLSLCSHPATSMITGNQFGDSHISQSIPLHDVANMRTAIVEQGHSLQESVGPSTSYYRQIGPLGPFTGYATILKSSRFLKPAQQLLDGHCGVNGKFSSSSIGGASDRIIEDNSDLAAAVNSIVSDIGTAGDVLGVPTSTRQDSCDIMRGGTSSPGESRLPDYQLKKAKLLYMLDEVSSKYKQYYQQMQMVVSAFESVAGLATTTPYISYALKTVSRNFNHLKNAISDQVRHIKNLLGEDFSLPPPGVRDRGDMCAKRSKYTDHCFPRHKSGGNNVGLIEPQQQIWRPQRGLPERAVSVLRAWLFEHFLHPYPTDTDKHMLATQTGLTRSQVSNWFINARVRLWKPMVEEVHMLETKSLSERKSNAVEEDDVSTNNVDVSLRSDHTNKKMVGSSATNMNLECSGMGALTEMGDICIPKFQWNQEKQPRVHSHGASSVDEGMMNISHYHRQIGHDMSGIGPVSLTLGLRQSADQMYRLDGNQHQHQHQHQHQQSPYIQQQHDHMRQVHLGGHSSTHEYTG